MLNNKVLSKNIECLNDKQKLEKKTNYVSINDLKSKVHKTSVGIIPSRER